MIRSFRPGAVPSGAALLTIVLSGCGTFSDNDAAATVGDAEVSRAEFEQLLAGLIANPEVSGLAADEATGTVPGENRGILGVLVRQEAVDQFLAGHGEEITDDDRAQFTDTLPAEDDLFELPADVQQVVIDQQVAPLALGRVPAPDAAELERRYDEDPAGLGVLCVRHILSDSQADAEDVVAELEAGADFAELAAERSTDPTAADNGGTIASPSTGEPCQPSAAARQGLDPAFVTAAATAVPGQIVGPVETQFGWHVVEAIPYDDAADSLTTLFEQSAGQLLLDGFVASLDIDVDPRYGVWDGGALSIQPLA